MKETGPKNVLMLRHIFMSRLSDAVVVLSSSAGKSLAILNTMSAQEKLQDILSKCSWKLGSHIRDYFVTISSVIQCFWLAIWPVPGDGLLTGLCGDQNELYEVKFETQQVDRMLERSEGPDADWC